jgi:hypothetical protein
MSRVHTNKFHRNDKRIQEINELRLASGLSPLKQQNKTCTLCTKEFVTYDNTDRRCSRCRHRLKEKSQRYDV